MMKRKKIQILTTCVLVFSLTYIFLVYINVSISPVEFSLLYGEVKVEKPVQIILSVESEVYRQRAKVANDACFRQSLGGQANRVFLDNQGKMAFCIVPKVGCTYWINIFRFLNNETNGEVFHSPQEIPRMITHYSKFSNNASVFPDEPGPEKLSNKLRFMFVRDPYSRLWSAWIDKFWLPDFWLSEGVEIAQFFKFKEKMQECPKNISFVEFLIFVTSDHFMKKPYFLNEHWVPYRYLCDPCLFRPHVIGKIETFQADTIAILESVNLTWVLDLPVRKEEKDAEGKPMDRSLQEMSMLTYYNLEVFDKIKSFFNDTNTVCLEEAEVFSKLWTAFQYNGHLPLHAPFPTTFLSSNRSTPGTSPTNNQLAATAAEAEKFLQICEQTYMTWRSQNLRGAAKDSKWNLMVEAYSKVPSGVMRKLQKLYAADFQMFGYDDQPSELFHYR